MDGVDTSKVRLVMEHRACMLAQSPVRRAAAAEGTQLS